ncbi:Ribose-5-phosphate isomerase A [bioreactor metagenome]|uniref:ribose-5-phosphate isomerase n=1 Tax=bioreactor metagenome TaxID=1076179 RepID=A0A644T8A6_9ZZZZ|nr:ribose-5-phosphate isomerase RpiA [Methanobrevibacter sp.]MEA4957667.1 ribose-5-phosphate isomerase RpiA [Methanobrevibacter sp.]
MNLKKIAGFSAAEEIKDGQIIGLGTGSTTHYFIEKVGIRMKEEGIEVMGVPTSYQSFLLAKDWKIPVTTLEEHDVDIAVDGADEIDPKFNLIKGGGAAHTLEKIVDYSADKLIIIADDSKLVDTLGKFPVPLEIISESKKPVFSALKDMGANPKIRMARYKDGPVISDNGNFIVDADFSKIDNPIQLEKDLNSIPGVVENGIFSQMVDQVMIGTSEGLKILK